MSLHIKMKASQYIPFFLNKKFSPASSAFYSSNCFGVSCLVLEVLAGEASAICQIKKARDCTLLSYKGEEKHQKELDRNIHTERAVSDGFAERHNHQSK